jgi:hypothetical protein
MLTLVLHTRVSIFFSDVTTESLGLLLENVGIDKAVHLGNPLEWRKAIAELDPK